jgi:hypothetical protein
VEAVRIGEAEAETSKMLSQGESKERRLIEEAKASFVNRVSADRKYSDVEHKVQQITEEAKDSVAAKLFVHQKLASNRLQARPIVEEAKTAPVSPRQTLRSIFHQVRQKAIPETKAEKENRTAIYQDRVELAIVPPPDFIQLERLRKDLQKLSNIRILSTEGSTDGRTAISIEVNPPSYLIPDLKKIDSVEEAFAEEALDSHPMGESLKKALTSRPSKRKNERKVLLVLKGQK